MQKFTTGLSRLVWKVNLVTTNNILYGGRPCYKGIKVEGGGLCHFQTTHMMIFKSYHKACYRDQH
jgi:hypothetical protein